MHARRLKPEFDEHRHRHPREDPRRHVRRAISGSYSSGKLNDTPIFSRGEDVGEGVGVGVGVVECQLYVDERTILKVRRSRRSIDVTTRDTTMSEWTSSEIKLECERDEAKLVLGADQRLISVDR